MTDSFSPSLDSTVHVQILWRFDEKRVLLESDAWALDLLISESRL